MIITPDSHPDEGRTYILVSNHHLIQAVVYAVQSKVSSTTSVC